MPNNAVFAATLRRLRESRRLSVADLAEAAGLSRVTLYELERGETSPSWHTVQALADALDVSTDAFLGPGGATSSAKPR